jgi:hypothetical protein
MGYGSFLVSQILFAVIAGLIFAISSFSIGLLGTMFANNIFLLLIILGVAWIFSTFIGYFLFFKGKSF